MNSIPSKTQIGPPPPSSKPKPLYSDQKTKQISQPSLANMNIKHPLNISSPESKKCGSYPSATGPPNKPLARYPVAEGSHPVNSSSPESSCNNISTNTTSSNNKCDMKQEWIKGFLFPLDQNRFFTIRKKHVKRRITTNIKINS